MLSATTTEAVVTNDKIMATVAAAAIKAIAAMMASVIAASGTAVAAVEIKLRHRRAHRSSVRPRTIIPACSAAATSVDVIAPPRRARRAAAMTARADAAIGMAADQMAVRIRR